ncbi:serine hydrolase domain-containing protein [Mycobacterium haemophilum]|uniref:Beta-lactamase n=1 Tax=Mycobacterium haemophilum TaxID=29311 RepID=A0A0I9U5H7_9MYCO|nr:serine hydrolase domain-containing protein [Mycobacterium haemophilum]KLO30330.1 beta-lactamase [Mycobacterium haemophilum]KLO37329.1 beta-lactamase [Mycobacterium haemophilum]KLO43878.1 beta-lactamase [Mycobacterium haemophilum]KLO49703.1 beta-lactamase [Mycobacterium haemophilum]
MPLVAGIAVLLTFATACAGQSPSTPSLDPATVRQLDGAIDDARRTASIPGAIVGLWGPQGQYVRAFGVSDKTTGAAMNADFYSRIGSETKTFTVTALLQLADQARVHLDDPIAKYVDSVPAGDRITLRQLARMQSGLSNYTNTQAFRQAYLADPHRHFSPQELLGYAFAQPPECLPGEAFHYSNTNTVLLGLVVEKVSGQSLPDYLREHVITPLGLSHTSFPTTNGFPEPHAQGYTTLTSNGAEATATDWDPSWAWAAGAMISTLDDLHVWTIAAATGKLLSPAMQRQRLETVDEPGVPVRIRYGLGIGNFAGWIGHDGTLPGYETVAVYLPDKQLTLVILTNTNIDYRGEAASMTLAAAVTKIVSPDHRYALSP